MPNDNNNDESKAPADMVAAMNLTKLDVYDDFVQHFGSFRDSDSYINCKSAKKIDLKFWLKGKPTKFNDAGEGLNYKKEYTQFCEFSGTNGTLDAAIFYQRACELERLVNDRSKYLAYFEDNIYKPHLTDTSEYQINELSGGVGGVGGYRALGQLRKDFKNEIKQAVLDKERAAAKKAEGNDAPAEVMRAMAKAKKGVFALMKEQPEFWIEFKKSDTYKNTDGKKAKKETLKFWLNAAPKDYDEVTGKGKKYKKQFKEFCNYCALESQLISENPVFYQKACELELLANERSKYLAYFEDIYKKHLKEGSKLEISDGAAGVIVLKALRDAFKSDIRDAICDVNGE
mmetsp:Transcript_31879/g.52579  ORF Transcript_31879/g.52579 Transcript_31879/m.52579 type:complete len:344 (+) Transcript_31879:247-1278(+)|eukprot:CAMPEP_0119004004 /NCGR_PEP_ID=MMETSP1176-20130426/893_1 /TAXON_ID=265551 /ORGANISM="Synedropsis recta cf, Strain CCMP1620" /LENGTH=343 /DNA_ID=CAMNT_0006955659 /DNA_START=226 /DNA_END=1257 /DNA_ORIENTATION=-